MQDPLRETGTVEKIPCPTVAVSCSADITPHAAFRRSDRVVSRVPCSPDIIPHPAFLLPIGRIRSDSAGDPVRFLGFRQRLIGACRVDLATARDQSF